MPSAYEVTTSPETPNCYHVSHSKPPFSSKSRKAVTANPVTALRALEQQCYEYSTESLAVGNEAHAQQRPFIRHPPPCVFVPFMRRRHPDDGMLVVEAARRRMKSLRHTVKNLPITICENWKGPSTGWNIQRLGSNNVVVLQQSQDSDSSGSESSDAHDSAEDFSSDDERDDSSVKGCNPPQRIFVTQPSNLPCAYAGHSSKKTYRDSIPGNATILERVTPRGTRVNPGLRRIVVRPEIPAQAPTSNPQQAQVFRVPSGQRVQPQPVIQSQMQQRQPINVNKPVGNCTVEQIQAHHQRLLQNGNSFPSFPSRYITQPVANTPVEIVNSNASPIDTKLVDVQNETTTPKASETVKPITGSEDNSNENSKLTEGVKKVETPTVYFFTVPSVADQVRDCNQVDYTSPKPVIAPEELQACLAKLPGPTPTAYLISPLPAESSTLLPQNATEPKMWGTEPFNTCQGPEQISVDQLNPMGQAWHHQQPLQPQVAQNDRNTSERVHVSDSNRHPQVLRVQKKYDPRNYVGSNAVFQTPAKEDSDRVIHINRSPKTSRQVINVVLPRSQKHRSRKHTQQLEVDKIPFPYGFNRPVPKKWEIIGPF